MKEFQDETINSYFLTYIVSIFNVITIIGKKPQVGITPQYQQEKRQGNKASNWQRKTFSILANLNSTKDFFKLLFDCR